MFNKLLPNFLRGDAGPRQPRTELDMKKAAVAALPPSFRTARHAIVEDGDPKAPPTFETGYHETEIRPGLIVAASNRTYRIEQDGSLRRPDARQKTTPVNPQKDLAAQRLAERLNEEEAARKRRRTRRAVKAANRTKARAKILHEKARTVLQGASGG